MAVAVTVAADTLVVDMAVVDMAAARLVEAAADIRAVVHHAAAVRQCTWAGIPAVAHRA